MIDAVPLRTEEQRGFAGECLQKKPCRAVPKRPVCANCANSAFAGGTQTRTTPPRKTKQKQSAKESSTCPRGILKPRETA